MKKPDYQEQLLKMLGQNQDKINKWLQQRPTITRTYNDLINDLDEGNIKYKSVPKNEWNDYIVKERGKNASIPGAFYRSGGESEEIHFPEGSFQEIAPHEILHYFAGHLPGDRGVPKKINPYIRADVALKGWLPSFHPGGRKPNLPGKTNFGQWWNQNVATKNTEYSNKKGYHPWFDEAAFDNILNDNKGLLQQIFKTTNSPININNIPLKYDNNNYPIYNKESDKASSFRNAFRNARKAGNDIFEWEGRKYNTKLK